MVRVLALSLLVVGSASFLLAGNPGPEIDPGSAAGALALVGGGWLVLRARRRTR